MATGAVRVMLLAKPLADDERAQGDGGDDAERARIEVGEAREDQHRKPDDAGSGKSNRYQATDHVRENDGTKDHPCGRCPSGMRFLEMLPTFAHQRTIGYAA